jgi:hypothetical protein
MLQSLGGGQQPTAPPSSPPAPASASPASVADTATPPAGPTTDLVGPWQAKRDDATFNLQLDEGGEFTWKSVVSGQAPVELSGTYTLANDLLILASNEQGAMIGRASPQGADGFAFAPLDGPANDPGLTFGRVK